MPVDLVLCMYMVGVRTGLRACVGAGDVLFRSDLRGRSVASARDFAR